MDYRDEVLTKLIVSLQNEYEFDTDSIRNTIVNVLKDYKISKISTSLVTSDMSEKIHLFLSIKKLEGLSIGSLKNYKYVLVDFSNHIFKPLNQVSTMDIRKYIARYYEKVKPSTLNSKLSKIRTFFTWLHDENYLENNPARNVSPIKVEHRERKGLLVEQLELMRTKCESKRERALLEFLYSTGCRVSEVVGLKVSDINFENMSLYVIGKGDKERKVFFKERAKIKVLDYLSSRPHNSNYLFSSNRKPHGGLGRDAIYSDIKNVGKRMIPSINTYPHLIRHTTATHMINSGMRLSSVQKLLGHSSPATTEIYAKLDEKSILNEYDKF